MPPLTDIAIRRAKATPKTQRLYARWRRWSSSGPVSCGRPSGPSSTSTRRGGASPKARVKMRQPHLVPLSRQALAVLAKLHPLTGRDRYVFPSARTPKRPMSDNAMSAAFRRIGYGVGTVTGHGFRAAARTILDEVLGFLPDIIEHQLAHAVRDPMAGHTTEPLIFKTERR